MATSATSAGHTRWSGMGNALIMGLVEFGEEAEK